MRTPARIVVPVAAAALPLTSCSSTANDTGGDQISLITDGTLTVCTNPPYEPFEFEQYGKDLNSSNCDVVASGITINDVRESKMDFSEPYFDADQGLLVPAGSSLASVEDLAGLTVGVQQATTGAEYATEQGLETLEFEDLGLQIEALRSGQIDAVINDIAVLGPFAGDEFEVGTTFPTGEQYGLGVKTGKTALLAAVNDTLARIMSDGTYDDIYIKYIGTQPTSNSSPANGPRTAMSLITASICPERSASICRPRSSNSRVSRPCSVAYSAPVVACWTPTVRPARSSTDARLEPAGTRRPWSASKYGSEKSIFDSRTSLMVMPEATTSQLLELRSSPDWMPSNSVTLIASSTPRSFATSFTMSMSRPTTLPSCSNSNGSYGGLVQTVRVPSVISEI